MEIFLIRHTATASAEEICCGHLDVELAENHLTHFEKIKSQLPVPDLVITSPSQRCRRLAQEIGSDKVIEEDLRIKELNFGEWEGKSWNSIDQKQLNVWMNDFVNVSCPKGEAYTDLFQRTKDFWNELITKDYKTVVVVTHGGVIRAILSLILDIPLKNSFTLKIDLGGISKVEVQKGFVNVGYVNLC